MNVRFIPNRIARNKLDAMRAILQSHYQVCIEEPDTFAVDRIRELEEENKKLKEEFTDYQKWARNCCDLLEEENSKLKEEVEEEREVKFSVMKTCRQYREENAKLKEELQPFKDRWIGT